MQRNSLEILGLKPLCDQHQLRQTINEDRVKHNNVKVKKNTKRLNFQKHCKLCAEALQGLCTTPKWICQKVDAAICKEIISSD